MKYVLKDTRRHEALSLALPGFDEALQGACERQFSYTSEFVAVSYFNNETHDFWNTKFRKSDVKCIDDYNPNDWNRTSDGTVPPVKALMRVVYDENLGRGCAWWDGKFWRASEHDRISEDDPAIAMPVKMFRPWG